jgi:hypothetical protein
MSRKVHLLCLVLCWRPGQWTEAKHKDGKGDVFILCHGTVEAGGIVKLDASLQFATITNSCHSGACGTHALVWKDTSLMEVKMLV